MKLASLPTLAGEKVFASRPQNPLPTSPKGEEKELRTGAPSTVGNGAMMTFYSSPVGEVGRGLVPLIQTVVDVPILTPPPWGRLGGGFPTKTHPLRLHVEKPTRARRLGGGECCPAKSAAHPCKPRFSVVRENYVTRTLVFALWCLLTSSAFAQSTTATAPATTTSPAVAAELKIQLTTEEGKKQIQATLTVAGQPVEGATVAFAVKRTFGNLPIGKDQTLDDGTAAVAFPADLPGGATGELLVIASVQAPTKYSLVTARATFGGAATIHPSDDEFPRALWAPRAPWLLVGTIVGIMAAVWCVYAYVLAQLWALYRGR